MKHLAVRDIPRLTRSPVPVGRLLACNSTRYFTTPNSQSRRSFHNSPNRPVVRPYLLADIGEGITECQIINWLVKPGDRVEQFDPICEVQSDKASVEITSRFDGTIKALHYASDDMAIVGKPLLDIDIDDDIAEGEVLLAEPAGQKNKGGQLEQAEEITKDEIQQSAGPHVPQTLEEIDGELRAPSSPPPNALAQPAGENAGLITPGVRHMLKELKLDITDIEGTGKDGRVLKEDIQRYTSVMASPSASTAGKYGLRASAEDRLVSLTPSENEMFKVMTRSLDIPHFLYTHTVDLASLNSLRRKFDGNGALSSALSISDDSTSKLTPLPFIMKTLSQAFVQFPRLNSHLDTDTNPIKPQLLIKASHDFGVAIDTPRGLLVPVVRDVQKHSIFSLAAEIKRLSSLAKEGRLAPDDFKGATFTISNIGSIGGNAVSPVIVAPMVGILGIGRVQGVPVFQKDEHGADKIVKREQVVLSWSADHRILDGATVAKCAETLGELLENIDTLGIALK